MVISQFKDTQLPSATHRDSGTPTHQTVEVSSSISTNYKLPHYCTLCLPSSVPCSPLSLHANVSTNTSSNAPRTSVQFFCNNGGKLSGNTVISCLQNGSWSGPVPSCGGGSTGNSFVPCYNHRCCLNLVLFNFLSNHLL